MNDPNEIPFRDKSAYVKQWKRNRKCAEVIQKDHPDWQVTIAFYTALHAINAAAAHLNEKPCNHTTRNDLVKSNQAFAGVRKNYLLLYRLSRFARYDTDPDSWLPEEYLNAQALIDNVLKPIENQIDTLINGKLNLPAMKMQK